MKIAYLCQSYPPMVSGAAIVVKRLAEEMVARGHSILVISASASCKENISHSEGIWHIQLRSLKNPKRVGQTFALFSGKPVQKCLTRFKPDILHTHDPFWLGLSGLTSARRLGIPTVITLHQLPWFITAYLPEFSGLRGLTEKGFWAYGDWLLQQFDRVIIPSQATAEVVSENTSCQPIVISNGMDLSRFSPDPSKSDEREYLHTKYGLDPS